MKKILSVLTFAFILSASAVFSADKVTIQLKWVTQAQFAGYYVAKDKGFYDAEGLDVTIKPGGPDIAPAQVLAGGGADVMGCLLYTSPSPRDISGSRMPSSA